MKTSSFDLDPFHDVGKLFPGETKVTTIGPGTAVKEALRIMLERRYSQLPVIESDKIRGIFSLWSLAQLLAASPMLRIDQLAVEDVMEQIPVVTVEDDLHRVLSLLEQYEAVLVNSPHGLQAIATSVDALRYFYRVARPFVLLGEIELALRALISTCASGERLREVVDRSIAQLYQLRKQPVPYELQEMTFDDYRSIIGSKDNWPIFSGTLGKNRELVLAKLERVRTIRNNVLHFRGGVTVLDHQDLAANRDWLLDKARMVRSSQTAQNDS